MTRDYDYKSYVTVVAGALAIGYAGGCGDDSAKAGDDAAPAEVQIRLGPSRSSTVALADDRAHVARVNPEDGTLSVFQTSDHARTAKVATGRSPSSVVIAADSKTAFVANRADGTVVRVTGIHGGTPAVEGLVRVGAEPVGLAVKYYLNTNLIILQVFCNQSPCEEAVATVRSIPAAEVLVNEKPHFDGSNFRWPHSTQKSKPSGRSEIETLHHFRKPQFEQKPKHLRGTGVKERSEHSS